VSLLLFFGAIYTTWFLVSEMSQTDIVTNEYPGVSVLNESFYQDRTLILDGDITLQDSDLTLVNCTVVFNGTHDKQYGIWTGGGTMLTMINCEVGPKLGGGSYTMEIHGSARFTGTSFENIWGDDSEEHLNGDGGLKVHNDDVVLEDCLITECKTNGILIDHCSPRIINCTIEYCEDDGIEMHGGEALIYGNKIRYNSYGIVAFDDCRATVDSNAFIENDFGLAITGSELLVVDNHFIDHSDAALIEIDSESVFRNNEYIGKKTDPETELMAEDFSQICLILFFLMSLLSFLILFIFNRRVAMPPRAKK
jgi:hypothetical protein